MASNLFVFFEQNDRAGTLNCVGLPSLGLDLSVFRFSFDYRWLGGHGGPPQSNSEKLLFFCSKTLANSTTKDPTLSLFSQKGKSVLYILLSQLFKDLSEFTLSVRDETPSDICSLCAKSCIHASHIQG